MYLQTDPVAWAKADRAEGVLSLAAEHSSNATENRRFQAQAGESVAQSFVRLVRERGQLPNGGLLEPEEELALASAWRARGDIDARNKIIEAHAPLIWGIAKELWLKSRKGGRKDRPNETFLLDDCIGAGCVGALEACKRFNPNYGVWFSAYARLWISGEIKEYLSRATSVVRGGTFDAEFVEAPPDELAHLTPDDEVTPIAAAASAEAASIQERALIRSQIPRLRAGIDGLNDRERGIFEARRLVDEPVTLAKLGKRFKISIERVRQIEARAIKKVGESFFGLSAQAVRTCRRISVEPRPDRCSWLGGVSRADNNWPCAWSREEIVAYLDRWPARPAIRRVTPVSDWRPKRVVIAKRWTDCEDMAKATSLGRRISYTTLEDIPRADLDHRPTKDDVEGTAYVRDDGAIMVEVSPHCYVNKAYLEGLQAEPAARICRRAEALQ